MRHLLLSVLLCVASGLAAGDGKLFESLSFQDALTKAEKEKKVVFIDFYTTWCGPCKMLDRSTFKDPKVISWLREKTVPIKIDAEIEVDLAKKYKVMGYPALVFVKPDGTAMNTLMGFQESSDLLENAQMILSGEDPMVKEKKEFVEKKADDPSSRMGLAEILVKEGKHEEALEEYLWCYDKGHIENPAFIGVRGSFLLSNIVRLGRKYPPALEALKSRREALFEKLKSGLADKAVAVDFANLNRTLGESNKTLAFFDTMSKDDEMRQILAKPVFSLLLEKKRYADIQENTDLPAGVEGVFKMYERMKENMKNAKSRMPSEEVARLQASFAVKRSSDYYQVYLGLKKRPEAAVLAQRILALDQGADTYNELARNAYLSGHADETHLEQARKAHELSEGKDATMIDTYARLLNQLDRKQEALALVREALPRFTKSREIKTLEECLAHLRDS